MPKFIHLATLTAAVLTFSVFAQPKPSDLTSIPQLRERATNLLVEAADTVSQDAQKNELRANALEALISLPTRLEPLARKAMHDQSLGVRTVAAMAAGKAKIKNLTDNLRPLTTDESNLVRASAIYALSRLGAGGVDLTPLAGLLRSEEPIVRAHVAYILGELGNRTAVPMLMEAAGAPVGTASPARDRLARLQIAEALAKLGKPEAIDEIRAAMYPGRPEDLEACALAVQIAGNIKDEGSRGQLRNMLADNYDSGGPMPAEIRLGAAMSLAKMGEKQHGPMADQYIASETPALRSQAAALYGELLDKDKLPKLAAMLSDPAPTVRIAAAAAIIKITEPR